MTALPAHTVLTANMAQRKEGINGLVVPVHAVHAMLDRGTALLAVRINAVPLKIDETGMAADHSRHMERGSLTGL